MLPLESPGVWCWGLWHLSLLWTLPVWWVWVDFGSRAATVSISKDPKGPQMHACGRRWVIAGSEVTEIWCLMLGESCPALVSPSRNTIHLVTINHCNDQVHSL